MTPPIKGYKHASYPEGHITQHFGLNGKLYGTICAADSSLTSGRYCLQGHNGIDIVAPWGTPLLAVKDGYIVDVHEDTGGFGKHVRLMSGNEEWIYAHCSSFNCKNGDKVKEGQVIAYMGNTGFVVSGSTPYWKHNPYAGTHLHLGKRIWNLSQFGIDTHRLQGEPKDYYNGFFGYVDYADELAVAAGQFDSSPAASSLRMTRDALYNQIKALFRSKLK